MLNEERIRVMTNLARYQEGSGKRDLEIMRYYRGDYIGMALIKNFFLVSIGYVGLLFFIGGYYLEELLEQMYNINVMILLMEVILGYTVMLVLYSAITYIICTIRYDKAKDSVQKYFQELGRLDKLYIRENLKNELLQNNRRM